MHEPKPYSDNPPSPVGDQPVVSAPTATPADPGFLPASPPRASVESIIVRVVATAGVIGIGTGVGAIMATTDVAGWIMGLVVATVSVVLSALLWRSRRL